MSILSRKTKAALIWPALLLCILLGGLHTESVAQDSTAVATDTLKKEKKSKKIFKGLLALPAISYSPETSLTTGAAILYNFDLMKNPAEDTRKSNARLLAIYTLKKQVIMELRWELFTKNEDYSIKGRAFYHKYPDRNYGVGNDAGAQLQIIDEDGGLREQNFIDFSTNRLYFTTTILRKIRPFLYAGLDYEFASLYNYRDLNQETIILTPNRFLAPATGLRSGLGAHFYFDNRDNLINAYKGMMLSVSNRNYQPFLGSEFTFSTLDIDFRIYKELWKDQIVAFNFRSDNKFTNENIPIRALGRMGGADFVKGYFFGTYQDNHLLAFQSEFRSLFLKLPNFPILKGIGAVAFFNGGRTYHKLDEFSLRDLRFSLGGGLRLLFLPKDRTNVGIDYAIGLHKTAGGDKRQSGIYFILGETF